MWVFLNDAFLSAVEHRDDSDKLMVRARLQGDLDRVFPDLAGQVKKTPTADYRFRLVVSRERFMQAMMDEVGRIDYTNFKNSVAEYGRHQIYLDVWQVMFEAQDAEARRLGAQAKGAR